MRLECRCFNDRGLHAAAETLDALRAGHDNGLPATLISDPALTDVVGGMLTLPQVGFQTRFQLGAWLYRELPMVVQLNSLLRSPGFWTWLAFFLFPYVCQGAEKVGENARYIFNRDNFRKRYRHLAAGPYLVFSRHNMAPQTIRGLLAAPPHSPGDLYEQFASRQELITSAAVMEVVNQMYFAKDTGVLKRGAATNARRLAEVLMHYDVTYDFISIPTGRLLSMLPKEFHRFIATT